MDRDVLVRRSLSLFTAPLLGALFCVFLPFIGFVLLGQAVVEAIMGRRSMPCKSKKRKK